MDVFCAEPLREVARDRRDRRDWRENCLQKWAAFVRREVRIWEVVGGNYMMLNKEHVGVSGDAEEGVGREGNLKG